jgi:uncharacterized membrane protein
MVRRRSKLKSLQATFLTGLLLLAPLAVTVWVLKGIYQWLDSLSPFGFLGGPALTGPALTLASILLFIFAIGWLSRTALGSILTLIDDTLTRVPGVNFVYNSVRDLVKAFGGDQHGFTHPVWLKVAPSASIRMIGFVTREDLSNLGAKGDVAVYLPHSYAISGVVVFVPKRLVKPVQTQGRDTFAFLATGGLTGANGRHPLPSRLP